MTGDILLTTRQVELIEKKKFVVAALYPEYKAFIIYIIALSIDSGNEMYFSRMAQIAYLKVNKALIIVPSKYTDFVDIFFTKIGYKIPRTYGD